MTLLYASATLSQVRARTKVLYGCSVGYDVGSLACIQILIVHAHIISHVLTKELYAHVHELGCIQSAPAVPGIACSMGGLALEVEDSSLYAVVYAKCSLI